MHTISPFRAVILVAFVLTLAGPTQIPAQSSPFSIRITTGAAYLPLQDWGGFFNNVADSEYQHHTPDTYFGTSVHLALSDRHAIAIGAERIQTSASLFGYQILMNETGDSLGILSVDILTWAFQGTPITLSYEYRRQLSNWSVIPFLSIGFSYFRSQVQADLTHLTQAMPLPGGTGSARKGEGYGIHATLGLVTQFTKHLQLISQVRYRYADGMAFTDDEGDIKVEFTGFDASLGLGWSF